MHWHEMDDGNWVWMASMTVLFWVVVIVGIVFLVRNTRDHRDRRSTAHEILDERFARGEISVEEYEQRRKVLQRTKVVQRS
jgi:putative membrane protein